MCRHNRSKKACEATPLLIISCWIEFSNFFQPIGHHNSDASVELVIQFCYRIGSLSGCLCMSPCSSDYIIAFASGARGRIILSSPSSRVRPSGIPDPCGGYICGLARDCLREMFPEFTRFASHSISGSERDQLILFQERWHRHATPAPSHGGLSAHKHRCNLDGACAGRLIGDRQTDIHFRNFPDDDAVVEQIAVLEERIFVQPIAFTRASLRVGCDDGRIRLQITEAIRPGEQHEIFATVLQLVRPNTRVGFLWPAVSFCGSVADNVIADVTLAAELAQFPATRLPCAPPNRMRSALSVVQVLR